MANPTAEKSRPQHPRQPARRRLTPTTALLLAMLVVGVVSAGLAFQFGRQALQGVNAIPDGRKLPRPPLPSLAPSPAASPSPSKAAGGDDRRGTSSKSDDAAIAGELNGTLPDPIATGEDDAVRLDVFAPEMREGDVVVRVVLRNGSTRPVDFLYSNLNVTNGRGRTLNVVVEGLPERLPPSGASFSGMIRIASSQLAPNDTLTIGLMDYPSQAIRLYVSGVSVARS